eukprot:TRINITY_DN33718_c0_g1_i2.p3 TRINITY_DN33718_c0_g1~~TRINITY_DN33718_c0_g1_i2.p3  ORF type:complete len:201 (+),score=38.21 TRINITY_DN33718_c0_g1_i2:153-755(+)
MGSAAGVPDVRLPRPPPVLPAPPPGSRPLVAPWRSTSSRFCGGLLDSDLVDEKVTSFLAAPPLTTGRWLEPAPSPPSSPLGRVRPSILVVEGPHSAASNGGACKVVWSVPMVVDGGLWRFSVRMSPLGVLCLENVLEYDAATALVRRRSASGGWGVPDGISPPLRNGRRRAGVVLIDVDTWRWLFRVGLDGWRSPWAPHR